MRAAILVGLVGCSLVNIRHPVDGPRCVDSSDPPAIDTFVALPSLALGGFLLHAASEGGAAAIAPLDLGIAAAVAGVVAAASAGYGYWAVATCRRARR